MSKKKSYATAIEEIEAIIYKIENDEPGVDELGELVKKAARLIKDCKSKLRSTEEDLNSTLEDLDK